MATVGETHKMLKYMGIYPQKLSSYNLTNTYQEISVFMLEL